MGKFVVTQTPRVQTYLNISRLAVSPCRAVYDFGASLPDE